MIKKVFIVTNNKLVKEAYPAYFVEGDFDSVLNRVRDFVHEGHALISHPLTGSVKPHETEYKSIILDISTGPVNFNSLKLIENAIGTAAKFKKPIRHWYSSKIQEAYSPLV
ncbi:hypothetical protein AZF37_06585 [endosymbiont 'TC1' of Trimyema compressum]|nr:hypothetical protein AZF37_06585 [endosymbiont 'TC1' of Trimyema compressum]